MLAAYIYERAGAEYENRILLYDGDALEEKTSFSKYFSKNGFTVVHYMDDLHLRALHSEVIYSAEGKYLLIASKDCYIPYDVIRRFHSFDISLQQLFPKLNAEVLRDNPSLNLNLLAKAYANNFYDLKEAKKTLAFVRESVYDEDNIREYMLAEHEKLIQMSELARSYTDWFHIAEKKAEFGIMAAGIGDTLNDETIEKRFQAFLLATYKSLSSELNGESPVLLSRTMEYMLEESSGRSKFAILVMDGMSEFDWQIFADQFRDIRYTKSSVFAMIPTTTSVSRQCLLAGKFPAGLRSPWDQSKEEAEFRAAAERMGFKPRDIQYARGFELSIGSGVKCTAVIINDVDNIVHAQQFGRRGMLRDITALSDTGQLKALVQTLLDKGFDVYITADHGNTLCRGIGKAPQTGVVTATKSRRMMVLKNIADKEMFFQKYGMIEFPKAYLPKEYDYLVCKARESFDNKGQTVMSHGGITIDEVIVPFIKIKAEDN